MSVSVELLEVVDRGTSLIIVLQFGIKNCVVLKVLPFVLKEIFRSFRTHCFAVTVEFDRSVLHSSRIDFVPKF